MVLASCGQREESATDGLEAFDWPTPSPAIYKITGEDSDVEGWLMGTIHALPDGIDWRTEAITQAIDDADYLILEVDNFDDSAATFSQLSTTPDLGALAPRVAPDLREDLNAMIARSHYSAASFRDMEEWAAAIVLSQVDAPGRAANGVDRALLTEFSDRDVRGFETAAVQFGAFDTLATADQRVLLEQTVRDWTGGPNERRELMAAWIAGDIERLEEATDTGIMADPELREALLVRRNAAWIAKLELLLRNEERPLVAVGAAHVAGPDGLPAMLEARGYTVERLP